MYGGTGKVDALLTTVAHALTGNCFKRRQTLLP